MVQYCLKIEIFINSIDTDCIMIKLREKSLFIEFMGDSSMIRVLDYLLTERELDFSITDLADNSNIGRATLYRIWENLIKSKIIIPTRIIGKAKLFKLNIENLKIQKLIEIYDMLIIKDLRQRSQNKKTKRLIN